MLAQLKNQVTHLAFLVETELSALLKTGAAAETFLSESDAVDFLLPTPSKAATSG